MIFREDSASRWSRLAARIERRLLYHNQWFIHVDPAEPDPLRPVGAEGFDLLPPPDRFWADPFLRAEGERLYVFVEELEFASNKGRISVIECDTSGHILGARKALEEPWHLSYPFLFDWDNRLWMLPEAGASGRLTLYCCERFPDRWVRERILMEGVRSADPTLLAHDGRWWLFLNIAAARQSIHDFLHLFSAPSPLGPFLPHPMNPVRRGPSGTRPAGPFMLREGELYRPAQDCARVYGLRTLVHRVTSLNKDTYAEAACASIEPGWAPGVLRTHTLSVHGGWRAVDGLRHSARRASPRPAG